MRTSGSQMMMMLALRDAQGNADRQIGDSFPWMGPGGDPSPVYCALLCVCSYWLASCLLLGLLDVLVPASVARLRSSQYGRWVQSFTSGTPGRVTITKIVSDTPFWLMIEWVTGLG